MRIILPACSRLSPFGLQSQPRLVPLRGRLLRRDFHFQTGGSDSESTSPSDLSAIFEAAFHGPDEYLQAELDQLHHSFVPGEVFEFGDDEYRVERKLRHRLLSRVWLTTHTNKRSSKRWCRLQTVDGPHLTFDLMFSASLSTDPEHNDDLHHVRYIKVRQDEGVPGSEYCDRALRVYLGPHLCIVKEPCGPTPAALQEMQPHGSFALPTTKRIKPERTYQSILKGLASPALIEREAQGLARLHTTVNAFRHHCRRCRRLCIGLGVGGPLWAMFESFVGVADLAGERSESTLLALDFLHTTMGRTHVGVNVHNIQVALLGPKGALAARIQDDLDANPPQMLYRSFSDLFRRWAPEESTKVLEAQPLPAFGLSPSLDNLEIRLSR
ncbi:hypothetical protein V8D89_011193 [Ganoderma adspersum]